MVQIFERISSFVLRVVRMRQEEYDAARPYSGARREWAERRASEAGTLAEYLFSMVYMCAACALEPRRLPPIMYCWEVGGA